MADEISFDWDQANVAHIRRHRVTPEEVEQMFRNNPREIDHDVIGGENRWTSVGHTDLLRVLVAVWTERGETTRVITAYTAPRRPRLAYLKWKRLI